MKIYLFKNKIGEIIQWTTGSAEYSVKFQDENKNWYEVEYEIREIDKEEGSKLQSGDYNPVIENEKLIAVKNISCIAKEMEEQEKKNLKEKFKTGNFTNEDIKKLADLML